MRTRSVALAGLAMLLVGSQAEAQIPCPDGTVFIAPRYDTYRKYRQDLGLTTSESELQYNASWCRYNQKPSTPVVPKTAPTRPGPRVGNDWD